MELRLGSFLLVYFLHSENLFSIIWTQSHRWDQDKRNLHIPKVRTPERTWWQNQMIRGWGQTDEDIPRLLDIHCNENPVYVFLFWELRGLNPNFHSHVSDLYSPRIGLHISSSRIGRPIVGIYKSLIDTWMWKLGLRPQSFSTATSVDVQGVFLFTVSSVTCRMLSRRAGCPASGQSDTAVKKTEKSHRTRLHTLLA